MLYLHSSSVKVQSIGTQKIAIQYDKFKVLEHGSIRISTSAEVAGEDIVNSHLSKRRI